MLIEELYTLFLKRPIVSTDTRNLPKDCIFFALKGDRFNGNKYAEDALQKGAAYAVIDEVEYQKNDRFILVKDVLTCLQQLANYHRQQFHIPVLAITGSNGKTTTKELISSVLATHYPTHYTKGNFNNHIGVPLTLLQLNQQHEVAIIEMGANHVGEIKALCEIAQPTHGIITNIGKAHLEGFGSLEGVKKAKSELYRYLELNNGMAFVNLDEAYLSDLVKGVNKILWTTQTEMPSLDHPEHEVILRDAFPKVSLAFLSRTGELVEVQTQLTGHYNFNNLMMAIAVGKYFKVPAQKIKNALENYVSTNNRSQLVQKGTNTYILDAYNANPSSMRKALENFSAIPASKRVAILGDMLELGDYSADEHQAIIDLATAQGYQHLILVGSEFQKTRHQNIHFEDVKALKKWMTINSFKDTHFLIKGSRGIQLEKILEDE